MKITALFIIAFVFTTSMAYGQSREQMFTGTVTDAETGTPIPGVNIVNESAQTGTISNVNGEFSLKIPENGAVIAFSYVGYKTERISYSGQLVMVVQLSPEIQTLEEVVLIGYGTIMKSDKTGAIASVSAKEIEKSTPVNIQSVLQGRVPGLMAISNSGAPGSEATIRIRGIGTMNNNNPIYVVDGTLIDNSDPINPASNIGFLNPSDIESVEVLKDASAQAIYGSRGANGIILITTRKGSEGLPKVTFSTTIGFGNAIKVPDVLNGTDFKDMVLTANTNGNMRKPNADQDAPPDTNSYAKEAVARYNKGVNTDWLNEVLKQNALIQNYYLSISGGTKNVNYAASAGYLNNEGLIQKSGYQRYSFRLNTDFKVHKNIIMGENLGITSATKWGPDYAVSYNNAFAADPVTPVLKPEDSVDMTDPNYEYEKYAATINGGNPVLAGELEHLKSLNLTLVGNMFAEVTILKDLKFRSSWGFNLAYRDESDYSPQFYLSPIAQNQVSSVSAANYRSNGWIWENTLTYSKILKDHSVAALLGYTSEYTKANYQTASKKGTPRNYTEMQTFDAATTDPTVTGGYNVLTMASWLGRINYAFRDKYLVTASLRHDGSSKFGPGHRWGTFPSFSLGWRISDEKFFKDLGLQFVSNLKLRTGWGRIGNSSLPVYNAYVSQVSSGPTDGWLDNRYIFGESVYPGYYLKTIGTPDISWETTQQANIGLELAILNNSVSFTADYYVKNTKDMLLQVPVVFYSGYPSTVAPYTNAGSVQNRGLEVSAAYNGKSGNFSYGAALNGSAFKNKITSLGRGNKPVIFYANRTEVGRPMGCFYGYMTNGIFQTEEEVQNYKGPDGTVLQPNAHAGDFRFKNLNADNALDAYDETWIGNPWPGLTYGFNLNLGYRAFDLVAFFQGTYGNELYRADLQRDMGFLGFQNTYKYVYQNAWHGPGTSNSQPIISTLDLNDNYRRSDYFVEDGSYLRLKNLQIGYNLTKELCGKVRITQGRFWIGGTNLLTFTKYRGIDPEVGASQTPTAYEGYDSSYAYPKAREISLGVTLTF